MAHLHSILAAAVATNASDVYLLEGTPPTLKVDGVTEPLETAAPLTRGEVG
jgi:Tfp pilus assembly pilus retraction ATPase PilT